MLISRFQYIISDTPFSHPLDDSRIYSHNNLHIQIHSSNSKNIITEENIIFFGECFDFKNPNFSNSEIVHSLIGLKKNERINRINKLSGQFIFLFTDHQTTTIYNDTAGQLEVFIHHTEEKFYISSEPQLIFHYTNNSQINYKCNIPSYIIEKKINIFGTTPFDGLFKLVPNFYYDVKNRKSIRFFPLEPIPIRDNKSISETSISILESTIESMAKRKRIALALTGGWDSRVLFAASLKQKDNIDYYILDHKTKLCDIDVSIASRLAEALNVDLKIIGYDSSSDEFNKIHRPVLWKENINQQKFAQLTRKTFPNHYNINGTVSEITKNFNDPLPNLLSLNDIGFITGVKSGTYENKVISEWMDTINDYIHILDLIQWENKMPNWAGSVRSSTNPYLTSISPFNNRYLLSVLLSSERDQRDKYFHIIYSEILNSIDEQLTKIPINPIRKQNWIKRMKKAGVYPLYRNILFRMRMLKI